jgi:hypothetical protein
MSLTLSFKGDAEGEFLERFFARSIAQMRFALGLGLFLYAVFGFLDAIAAPAQRTQLWVIRYGIGCPIIFLIWALSFTASFRRYAQLALMIMVFAAGTGIVAMTVITPPPVNYLYHAGLILVLMFAFSFVRLRFVYSSLVSIAIVAIYLITTVIVGTTPTWIIVNNAFFLLTAFILGGFAAYSIELYERRNFLQTREIAARTADLLAKNDELLQTNTDLVESRRLVIESSRRAQLIFSALADALPGTDLENKYRLEEKIGSGGFGTVYRARHLLLDAPVAVKIFRPVGGMSMEKSFERFRLEGISGKRIAHPNAVAVLDFGIASSAIAFLVMELLEGHTLSDEMRTVGKLPVRRCAEIAIPICSVLAEAHKTGIIHRDIKPSNIFLHQSRMGEVVKVVDFGIAKLLEPSTAEDLEELTATGIVIGTPSYIAPERFASQVYGASSDVYSIGVLLYQMLTGHVPHATTVAQMIEPARPPKSECDMPGEFSDLIVRALSIKPAARPSAAEMALTIAEIFKLPLPVSTLTGDVAAQAVTHVDSDAQTAVQDPSNARTATQPSRE